MAVIYPIGIQNFESLHDGYLYIDKTAFVHELTTTGRYYFLTGVTKFGKVSVFSDLNNLQDISMDERYEMDGRKLVKIGVNFDSRIRSMDKWKIS